MYRLPRNSYEFNTDPNKGIDYILSAIRAIQNTNVSQIIAGTNISISPASGTGAVTINAILAPTPTLDQVTTAGNTTANNISVGKLSSIVPLSGTYQKVVNFGTTTNGNLFYLRDIGDALLASNLWLGTQNGSNWIGPGSFGISSGSATGQTFFDVRHNNGNRAIRIQSNSNVVLNETAGNVLIGTTTDSGYKLDVNGAVNTNSYFQSLGTIFGRDSRANNFITYSDSSVVSNRTLTIGNATYSNVLFPNGNVGIGTTSPSQKLDVAMDTDVSAVVGRSHVGYVGFVDYAGFSHVDHVSQNSYSLLQSSSGYTYLNAASTAEIRFRIDNADKMRLFTTGNFAIGTITDAGYKLNVNGTIKGTNIYGETYRSGRADGDVYIQAATATDFVSIGTQVAQNLLRVQGDGNVGIGTSVPGQKLDVNGTIRTNSTFQFYNTGGAVYSIGAFDASYYRFFTSGTERIRITNAGNVGIGTASPDVALDIQMSTASQGLKIRRHNNSSQYLHLHESDGSAHWISAIGNKWMYIDNQATSVYGTIIRVNGNDRVVFTNGGNVLIGTTTDNGYLLQVSGDATINGVRVGLGGGSIQYNAVLGQQAGDSNTTGTITAVGYQALRDNTTGGENVAVGRESMRLATASNNTAVGTYTGYLLTSGYGNTIVGRRALFSATTATYNTALGYQALHTSTASNNTAVGANAAYSNTTGSIVAVGYEAGFSNTTSVGVTAIGREALKNSIGADNTALGYAAAYNTTTGIRNVAVGKDSLLTNSTGQDNVAIGESALRNNTSSFNTAIGREASLSNTSGNSNTAVGYQSLKSNATSSGNSAVGLYALLNTTAASNTAVGQNAGRYNTTGSNNIFIGKDSDGVAATDSNRTFIGNSSTTSTWLGGNLLVGTTTDAGYKLDVQGGDARFAQNVEAATYSVAGNAGYSGIVNFPSNPPGSQNLEFLHGILINVF